MAFRFGHGKKQDVLYKDCSGRNIFALSKRISFSDRNCLYWAIVLREDVYFFVFFGYFPYLASCLAFRTNLKMRRHELFAEAAAYALLLIYLNARHAMDNLCIFIKLVFSKHPLK